MRDDLDLPVCVDPLKPLPEIGVYGGFNAEVGSVADVEIENQIS